MVQRLLRKLALAVNRIESGCLRSCPNMLCNVVLDPVDEARCLRREANAKERVNREGCITKPGIPVIPIADSTYDFWQAGRGSSYYRARGLESEQLQGQRRSVHLFPPASPISACAQ